MTWSEAVAWIGDDRVNVPPSLRPRRLGEVPADRKLAAHLLRSGALVALPTETVYGLAGRADDDTTVGRIYDVKGRPQGKPIAVLVSSLDHALTLWADGPWLEAATALAQQFWPGPLTIVCPAKGGLSPLLDGGTGTLGVRCPNHPLTLDILRQVGVPLATPSANPSEAPSPTCADHVEALLPQGIDAIVDGGPSNGGMESTIVSIGHDTVHWLRSGALSHHEITAALPSGWHIQPTHASATSLFDALPLEGSATLELYTDQGRLVWREATLDALIQSLHSRLAAVEAQGHTLRRWQGSTDIHQDPRFDGIASLIERYLRTSNAL